MIVLLEMEHRHIDSCDKLSAAAIDDIIDRGGRADWAFLRDRSREDESVMQKIRRVCAAAGSIHRPYIRLSRQELPTALNSFLRENHK